MRLSEFCSAIHSCYQHTQFFSLTAFLLLDPDLFSVRHNYVHKFVKAL
jgi:hypothetical protein